MFDIRRIPPEQVREELAEYRRRGVDFDLAWRHAVEEATADAAQAGEWRAAVEWARPAFERAYAGAAPATGDRVQVLYDELDPRPEAGAASAAYPRLVA